MSGTRDAISLLSDPEPFEAVVDGTGSGPLAVVGDPYAGREQVLGDDPDVPADGGPVVVDDCQHLYTRVVGGFDHLEAVLDLLARTERTVVTGWNRCAWAYLTTVRTDETVFADGVELGTVAPDRLAELVLARYGSVPSFERDEAERTGPVSVRRYTVDIGGRTLSVPVPVPDLSGATGPDADVDPQDVVFERLAAAADGNVGVATALWERGRADAVRPSDIAVPGSDLALDRDEAFCLRTVLAKERLRRAELGALLDRNPDRIIARLVREDVVTVADDEVRLNPAAVPAALDSTERERIV